MAVVQPTPGRRHLHLPLLHRRLADDVAHVDRALLAPFPDEETSGTEERLRGQSPCHRARMVNLRLAILLRAHPDRHPMAERPGFVRPSQKPQLQAGAKCPTKKGVNPKPTKGGRRPGRYRAPLPL